MGDSIEEVPSKFGDKFPDVIMMEVRRLGGTGVMIECRNKRVQFCGCWTAPTLIDDTLVLTKDAIV